MSQRNSVGNATVGVMAVGASIYIVTIVDGEKS